MLMHILHLTEPDRGLTKFTFGTRTSMAVFAVFASMNQEKAKDILDYLVPNNTEVWVNWKSTIVNQLESGKERQFNESDWGSSQDLVKMLDGDAKVAYQGFKVFEPQLMY
ncbi:hypothetical protein SCLCIDRAFT_1225097 [Scleroderma citrinum Foug A]|uniref:Uncharacterized protein n=1 Tax=Scleroderma citrinum Foug A TaxID=1036808 RepID=A0A0C2YM03_9AGAM|nr:hypothetical protein SCLCIDRAFT_1225097 [Scleroderma citrinum Foug A]